MIITCDAHGSMGYIYLQPPKDFMDYQSDEDNHISKYVDPSLLHIALVSDESKGRLLQDMRLSDKTYQMAVGDEIDEEYQNDLDENGYMTGIELTLSKETFIQLLKNRAFTVYQTEWQGLSYHIATFDTPDKVFDSNHVIYPLHEKQDAFLIIEVSGKYKIGLVKAVITRRNDLYPVDYLLAPHFRLWEDSL